MCGDTSDKLPLITLQHYISKLTYTLYLSQINAYASFTIIYYIYMTLQSERKGVHYL